MKSRNTVLLLVVLVVLGIAAYFFSRRNESRSTLGDELTAFTVADTAAVDKIFVSSKAGKTHTIQRQPNGQWMLDQHFEARQDMVNLLLETLKRMEVKRPADKDSRNQAIRDFATMGRKVEIYQHGKLAKTFYVGQTTDNDLGTYFIMQDSEDPYVLHIPGFNGFISTRFDINELDWRSVSVFRNKPETIRELSISYVQNPEASFKIAREGNLFNLDGKPVADQENMKAYLQNYSFINGEFFIPNMQNRVTDSLALQKPFAIIAVTDEVPANSRTITLFAKPDNTNHYTALDDKTREVMSVQTYVFDRLLVKKDAFAKKSSGATK